jgi:Circularly permutated YpsA SLOG family
VTVIVRRIISGGQTGADRAALDVAIELGIDHGGYVPLGRWAEDGPLDAKYHVAETASARPEVRTAANVRAADGTLILSHGPLTGGSALTLAIAQRQGKPVLHVDLDASSIDDAVAEIRQWIARHQPAVLNVAGPRASSDARIHLATQALLRAIFEPRGEESESSHVPPT